MKVSIVIPAFNVEHFLERCLVSIISQTYENIEILLIDDGSKDGTSDKGRFYSNKDSRIKFISQENKGVSSARNKGIEMATGEYITFVDPDDYLETEAIQRMVTIIEEYDVDCVRMSWKILKNSSLIRNSQSLKFGYYDVKALKELRYKAAIGEVLCYSWVLMLKRDVVVKNKLNFPLGVTMMEDTWFFMDMLDSIKSMYISDEATYVYEIHDASAMRSTKGYEGKLDSIVKVNQHIARLPFTDHQIAHVNAVHASNMVNLTIVNAMRVESVIAKSLYNTICKNQSFRDIYSGANTKQLFVYHRIVSWAAFNNITPILYAITLLRKIVRK